VPREETWQPGSAGHESLRQQGRYDQSRTEEHPGAAGESDDDDDEVIHQYELLICMKLYYNY